jgi:hypothetical protein
MLAEEEEIQEALFYKGEVCLVWGVGGGDMEQITIKTPNPKCRSLLMFDRVYRLEIQSIMLVFSTPLVNYRPLTFNG